MGYQYILQNAIIKSGQHLIRWLINLTLHTRVKITSVDHESQALKDNQGIRPKITNIFTGIQQLFSLRLMPGTLSIFFTVLFG